MTESEPKRLVRVTVNLYEESVQGFRLLALRHGVNNTEELNQIIADRVYLEEQIAQGSKLLLETSEGEFTQVIFRLGQNPKMSQEDS